MKTNASKTENRHCPFCGNSFDLPGQSAKKSNEHVIAQWLQDHLDLRREHTTSRVLNILTKQHTDHRQVTTSNFVYGRVCRPCNNGWMARLEGEVKPILIRLIEDPMRLNDLTNTERHLVARWTVKTAAVFNRVYRGGDPTNPDAHPVPAEHLVALKAGVLPQEIVVVASGCPYGWRSTCLESATWALMPEHSIPLTDTDRKKSYKVGLSFGQLLLGVAYYPSPDYYYAVRYDKHSILWGNTERIVRLTDKDALEVPTHGDVPIMEGFLGNVALVSKVMWELIQNTQKLGLIAKP